MANQNLSDAIKLLTEAINDATPERRLKSINVNVHPSGRIRVKAIQEISVVVDDYKTHYLDDDYSIRR